ncbi:MAG: tRNA glutamyl-Q(34) synthetase GluQRS [Alphaproteobacteria bacterium]|nr:tRNA glutamyl-Q(34) synthetase GluQRS [Alphaproteobacteria bacterium]
MPLNTWGSLQVTRFAPSPTGFLHKGHAYSALIAYRAAEESGGRFLLRIEDIDVTRCRPEYTEAIFADLAWLGINWEPQEVLIQSEHMNDYQAALAKLDAMGLIYKCFCTRKEIAAEAARIGGAPHAGETIIYPGTCRNNPREAKAGENYSLRLDIEKALKITGEDLFWEDKELGQIKANPLRFGDVILARKDTPASYYLACTIDDARQGVTLVTRGEDLRDATDIQVLLQALLDLPTPLYYHHKLMADKEGKRLAKRSDSESIRSFKERGMTSKEFIAMLEQA